MRARWLQAGHTDFRFQRLTGDLRGNVNPGILALHGLFVLEHNRSGPRIVGSVHGGSDAFPLAPPVLSRLPIGPLRAGGQRTWRASTLACQMRSCFKRQGLGLLLSSNGSTWRLCWELCCRRTTAMTRALVSGHAAVTTLTTHHTHMLARSDPSIDVNFAIAAYRYGHSGIGREYWCLDDQGARHYSKGLQHTHARCG